MPTTNTAAAARPGSETLVGPTHDHLADKWLEHFGVADPMELDLGVLMTIGELVRDGLSPPDSREP